MAGAGVRDFLSGLYPGRTTEVEEASPTAVHAAWVFSDAVAVVAVLIYFLTERQRALETEKAFWLIMGVYVGGRGAMHLHLTVPGAVVLILLVSEAVSALERKVREFSTKMHSNTLWQLRKEQQERWTSELDGVNGRIRGYSFRLRELVDRLHRTKSGGLRSLLVGLVRPSVVRTQNEIHDIILSCDEKELNYQLCVINCSKLSLVSSAETLKLLAGRGGRIGELTVESKTFLVDGIQRTVIHSEEHQRWTRDLVLSVIGEDLSYMKALLDSRGDWQSLHKLVFYDLHGTWQQQVLRHLHSEGMKMREEQPQPMIKVVSDVDDTLVSSGGIWPAGIDRRIPRGAMYPGAGTIFRELHRHSNSTTARTGKAAVFEAASLLLLTARPKAYKGMSENFSFKKLVGPLKRKDLLKTEPVILSGDLKSALWVILHACLARIFKRYKVMPRGTAIWSPVADRKAEAIHRLMMIYQECDWILVGDNGQGDVLCSELLAEGSGRRAGIRLTLINEVRPVPTTLSKFLKPVRPETCEGPDGNTTPKEWRELKIEIFSTYVGAARLAFEQGLLDQSALIAVAKAAVDEVHFIQACYGIQVDAMHQYMEAILGDLQSLQSSSLVRKKSVEELIDQVVYMRSIGDPYWRSPVQPKSKAKNKLGNLFSQALFANRWRRNSGKWKKLKLVKKKLF